MATKKDGSKEDSSTLPVDKDGIKNPGGQESGPRDAYTPPQVVDRDEIKKSEYSLEDGKLEIDRGHPNHIFDNQRNQQAQENTVEIAQGIRNDDGSLKENHPASNDK